MGILERRDWKRTLLELMLSNRTLYDLGLSPLLHNLNLADEWNAESFATAPFVDLFGNSRLEKIKHVELRLSMNWPNEPCHAFLGEVAPYLESLSVSGVDRDPGCYFFPQLQSARRLKKPTLMCHWYRAPLLSRCECFFPESVEHLVLKVDTLFPVIADGSFEEMLSASWPNLVNIELLNAEPRHLQVLRRFLAFLAKVRGMSIC